MNRTHLLIIALPISIATLAVILALTFFFIRRGASSEASRGADFENSKRKTEESRKEKEEESEDEDLVAFRGGEGLTICDILEAPGEVIGKSKYGTLYRAELQRIDSVRLLRFLRPACTAPDYDVNAVVQVLGDVRHSNLVSLLGFYAGPRGEKLLIHPFYRFGNLAEFIRGEFSLLFRNLESSSLISSSDFLYSFFNSLCKITIAECDDISSWKLRGLNLIFYDLNFDLYSR